MSRTMKACASLFRIRVVESFQYRTAALSGTVTSLLWGFIEAAVLTAFFVYAGFSGGLTLEQAISHVWVRELLLFLQGYHVDEEIRTKLDKGDVGVEMCRPLDLYWHWFARSSAGKIVGLVMRCIPCFLLAFLIPGGLGARLPVSFAAFVLFLLSMMCAFLLCSALVMFVTAIRTNITWGDGPVYMIFMVGIVLSGGMLPLQLWPDFLQTFLLLQPFAGMTDIPARLYIGSMPLSDAWFAMGIQLFWSAAFIAAGKFIMSRRLRTIIAQGG